MMHSIDVDHQLYDATFHSMLPSMMGTRDSFAAKQQHHRWSFRYYL